MKDALLIAPNFPPINKISSLRPYYLALELAKDNWNVTVFAEDLCRDENSTLERPEENLNVVRIKSKNRILWIILASIKIISYSIKNRSPKIIISTYGPSSSHILGFIAKIASPKKSIWAADYRDLWTSGNYYSQHTKSPLSNLKSGFEKAILTPASLITTVSKGLKNNLAEFHKKETHIIYNGFEGAPSLPEKHQKNQKITICYTGTIYKERSPEPLLKAIHETPELLNKIEIIIAGDVDTKTQNSLKKYEGTVSLKILGKVSREESYAIQRRSDFCLLVEDYDASKKGVLTGKVFEYISAGKPIIALGVANESEIAELIMKSGLMAFCGKEPIELKKFLTFISESHTPTAIDIDFIQKLSRQAQSRIHLAKIYRHLKNAK